MLRKMVLLLNSDSYLLEDPTSISKAILLAIETGQIPIAYSILVDIFLRQQKNSVSYTDKQFCQCLLTVVERLLEETPKNLLTTNWIQQLVSSFLSLDIESFNQVVSPIRFFAKSSDGRTVRDLFALSYLQSVNSRENRTDLVEGDSIWGIDHILPLDGVDVPTAKREQLSWYRFRITGYMVHLLFICF